MGIEFGLYYSHALKIFFSEAKGFTVPFFMKEGVDGEARRGNCERGRSTGVVVIKKSDYKTLEKI